MKVTLLLQSGGLTNDLRVSLSMLVLMPLTVEHLLSQVTHDRSRWGRGGCMRPLTSSALIKISWADLRTQRPQRNQAWRCSCLNSSCGANSINIKQRSSAEMATANVVHSDHLHNTKIALVNFYLQNVLSEWRSCIKLPSLNTARIKDEDQ